MNKYEAMGSTFYHVIMLYIYIYVYSIYKYSIYKSLYLKISLKNGNIKQSGKTVFSLAPTPILFCPTIYLCFFYILLNYLIILKNILDDLLILNQY